MSSRLPKRRLRAKVATPDPVLSSHHHNHQPTLFTNTHAVFSGAHHFGIDTAVFQTTNNNITNLHPPTVDPYSILHGAIAIEATQTSKTAQYAPKCHPETRIEITGDIVDMVEFGEEPIIWFSGPAGGGKTCIMREVADRCQKMGWPTCTYFFSTRVSGLSTSSPFVATIVSQLLEAIPPLRPYILDAISTYPTIFQRSLDFQMEKLIIEPVGSDHLRASTPGIPSTIVLVIDGYDECSDVKERQHLLRLLEFINEKVSQSIIIVIASRPELDIRTSFDNQHLKSITRPVLLHSYDGKSDVLIYFADEFERIRQTHPRRAQIPEGWPVEEIVHTLIDKSSGNFALPATIIKYISNLRRNPVEMLERVLAAFSLPTDDNPLAEIDALYSLVLHPPDTDIPRLKRILHWITAITKIYSFISSPLLDGLLQFPSGTVEDTLCDLHSVVQVPSPDNEDGFRFHHKSLEDFLLSPGRSRDLFQASYETHLDLVLVCSQHLLMWAANPTANFHIALNYAIQNFNVHFSLLLKAKPISAVIPDAIVEFDARIIARIRYVLDEIGSSSMRKPSRAGAAQAVYESIPCEWTEWGPRNYKMALLPHFDLKTGLYNKDEIDELPYPVGPHLLPLKLETICKTHPLKTLIPNDWPTKDTLNALVCEDRNNLLVPSLIVQLLRNPRRNPVEILEKAATALSSIPLSGQCPRAQFDVMYTLVLHPPDANIPLITRILHCMVVASQAGELRRYDAATRYDRLFGLPAGTSEAALSDVDPVLPLFSRQSEYVFYPQSLENYLLSPDRSNDMFQSEQETHLDIILSKARFIQKWAELSWSPHQGWNPDPTKAWRLHFKRSVGETSPIPAALLQIDLRLVWRYMYCYDPAGLLDYGAMAVLGPSRVIQSQHCTDAECPWCRILNRMKRCAPRVKALFQENWFGEGSKLPRFDIESGLYDDDEFDQLSYPVGRRLLALRAESRGQASN